MKDKLADHPHPTQPIDFAADGVVRFKSNEIVMWMLKGGNRFDLNIIADMVARKIFSVADYVQLMQLIGYSVCSFGDLSMVPSTIVESCDEIAAKVVSQKNKS